jgi:uracil-DNA glycosylase family 4
MQLFPDDVPEKVGSIADIYGAGFERKRIDYTVCEGCPLRGNPKVWAWRGDKDSKLCLVGMNPGAVERKYSIPFVGPAGRELDRQIISRLGLGTEQGLFDGHKIAVSGDFYLTNIVKCWTANNADPSMEAVAHCWKHLEPELEGRRLICPMGRLAEKAFAKYYQGSAEIFPIIHPSAALRRGIYRAKLIHDAKEIGRKVKGSD